ncbi:hypothetical protein M441DRAFT_91997 [Trichoderma asperellum CBS 433.97]|uniref:Uncharacterized protein n=1 Tax=Trichoderma asperellum (strain ATCC 204424 / CBS 433.97 / NBRC 101777) TaxID=1042311 RepID=A0A2T3Z108_TRIA4|nr:hypothetical protein M441DRAFT_91997 [Trichoderma asperellum CBS 433.97]PTB38450.1 hypothetical protein M441DRAFT_91997 [Trichoderma asperellum CBS 433.97]
MSLIPVRGQAPAGGWANPTSVARLITYIHDIATKELADEQIDHGGCSNSGGNGSYQLFIPAHIETDAERCRKLQKGKMGEVGKCRQKPLKPCSLTGVIVICLPPPWHHWLALSSGSDMARASSSLPATGYRAQPLPGAVATWENRCEAE